MGDVSKTTKPTAAYAMLDPKGQIIVNSVRTTQDEVRLAAGEGTPIAVLVMPMATMDELVAKNSEKRL